MVEHGNVAEALTRAARVFEGTFRTQIHAPWAWRRAPLWPSGRAKR